MSDPIDWAILEAAAGKRLDRRRRYIMDDDGLVLECIPYVSECSGCTELCDGQNIDGYPLDPKHGCLIGSGCRECGHTGKRRNVGFAPVNYDKVRAEKGNVHAE